MIKSNNLLDKAYKCKSNDLELLLKEIEVTIKNSEHIDKVLLRAKTVTSKLAAYNSK
jgi:hypothetical protein